MASPPERAEVDRWLQQLWHLSVARDDRKLLEYRTKVFGAMQLLRDEPELAFDLEEIALMIDEFDRLSANRWKDGRITRYGLCRQVLASAARKLKEAVLALPA